MGNPMWSYKEMCLETDRLIRDADEIDKKSDFKTIEERLRKCNHNKNFYYNCGVAVSKWCPLKNNSKKIKHLKNTKSNRKS